MPWADQVPAVLEAWYPGAGGRHRDRARAVRRRRPGRAAAGTFPRREEDPPTAGRPERYPGVGENAEYSEGVFVGYRHYDEHGIAPRFPFGHGLSYTRFRVLAACGSRPRRGRLPRRRRRANTGPRRRRRPAGLRRPALARRRAAAAAALKGFAKVTLGAGRARRGSASRSTSARCRTGTSRRRAGVAPGCYPVEVARRRATRSWSGHWSSAAPAAAAAPGRRAPVGLGVRRVAAALEHRQRRRAVRGAHPRGAARPDGRPGLPRRVGAWARERRRRGGRTARRQALPLAGTQRPPGQGALVRAARVYRPAKLGRCARARCRGRSARRRDCRAGATWRWYAGATTAGPSSASAGLQPAPFTIR